MTLSAPKYAPGDTVYLKESAAIGSLEAVSIGGITISNGKWLYAIQSRASLPSAATMYGDKISLVNAATLWFDEGELISVCEALTLAEANAQRVLDQLKAQKASLCD